MTKTFRGKTLQIKVKNPDKKESGCKELYVNGVRMEGNYIPETVLKENNSIELLL